MSSILISGVTFIKNGLSLGYPILESALSIEPICDEIIINVGFEDEACTKDDGTYEFLRDHLTHPKFVFLKSHWDPDVSAKGIILSQQTNIALAQAKGKYCQYIQGDEALHECDLKNIQDAVWEMERRKEIEGLIFNYLHFYGSVDVYKHTRNTYRREVRLIRNHVGIKSWLDAQGFRHSNEEKIKAKPVDARVFHYGWARPTQLMNAKNKAFNKLYHGKEYEAGEFEYERIWGLKKFQDTHPEVMEKWINANRTKVDVLNLKLKNEWKNVGLAISDFIEKHTGYRLGEYKNYIPIT